MGRKSLTVIVAVYPDGREQHFEKNKWGWKYHPDKLETRWQSVACDFAKNMGAELQIRSRKSLENQS